MLLISITGTTGNSPSEENIIFGGDDIFSPNHESNCNTNYFISMYME